MLGLEIDLQSVDCVQVHFPSVRKLIRNMRRHIPLRVILERVVDAHERVNPSSEVTSHLRIQFACVAPQQHLGKNKAVCFCPPGAQHVRARLPHHFGGQVLYACVFSACIMLAAVPIEEELTHATYASDNVCSVIAVLVWQVKSVALEQHVPKGGHEKFKTPQGANVQPIHDQYC